MSLDSRIHIVFLIDFLATRDNAIGGTERQLVELVNHIDKERFRPIVFCMQEFHDNPLWDSINCEKHVLHVYSLASVKGLFSFFSFIRFLMSNSIDIVQTYFHDSTLFGILASRIARVKVTISCRRDLGFWYDRKMLRNLSLINLITRRVLVNSNAVKDAVLRYEKTAPGKIDVILNGIDLEEMRRTEPADLMKEFPTVAHGDNIVGMVANFNRPVKRLDLFIRSAAEIRKQHPQAKFLVIGRGKMEKELRGLIHELGLEGTVILGGARESIAGYIKRFDIGVLTSDSEGFSNVILEYMAAGIPVVATAVGGNKEIIRDESLGVLVPPGDPLLLAEAISRLLKNDMARKEMGIRARKFVENYFSWEKKINEYDQYYHRLLVNHG